MQRFPCLAVVAAVTLLLLLPAASTQAAAPDADHDGVPDSDDYCADTPSKTPVDDAGCSQRDMDWDGDGVCNPNRPRVSSGLRAGKLPQRLDRWCSGIDNCRYVANPDQVSSRGSDAGDACNLGQCQGGEGGEGGGGKEGRRCPLPVSVCPDACVCMCLCVSCSGLPQGVCRWLPHSG